MEAPYRPDFDRRDRTGVPEVVLAEGKRDEDLLPLVERMVERLGRVLVSRLDPRRVDLFEGAPFPFEYHKGARVLVAGSAPPPLPLGRVGILAAGTADAPLVEELEIYLEEFGASHRTAMDVGVAGIHRLFSEIEWLSEVDVVIVVAGREGALAPVVAGLTDRPVVGLPSSQGYGVGGGGEAALLSMLQSCSPLAVVNVDNAFSAAAHAAKIVRLLHSTKTKTEEVLRG